VPAFISCEHHRPQGQRHTRVEPAYP
jgi:hypothetical protein